MTDIGDEGAVAPRGRLKTVVGSTAFLVACVLLALGALAAILLFPDIVAGIVMVVAVAFVVLAVLAALVSVVMTVAAFPLYLAKGEHVDSMDYDIADVKEREEPR